MVVQHNISAMNANRYYTMNNSALGKSLEKLSSGYAINRAGDNAAGLAVSEKMRAQIAGMTQASKNAQDGISMVQTFEGALQETDSILQRMRTLAVQSANGSYANEVDREAIQLEFNQLNDELNQIADTDFNGVVMLNGGQMADGLRAVDGKFDYANKRQQLVEDVGKILENDVNAKQTAYEETEREASNVRADFLKPYEDALAEAQANKAAGKFDVTETGETGAWNTVDNHLYNKDVADKLWDDLDLTLGTEDGKTTAERVDITFTYDKSTNAWTATSARAYAARNETDLSNSAKTYDESELTGIVATPKGTIGGDSSGFGGFTVKSDSTTDGQLGNAIVDATDVTDGSTITLSYTNGARSEQAPTNIGFYTDYATGASSVASEKTADVDPAEDLSIALDDTVEDDIMNTFMKDAFDELNGMQFHVDYDKTKDVSKISITDNTGTEVVDAKDSDNGDFKDSTKGLRLGTDSKLFAVAASDGKGGTIDIYAADASDPTKISSQKLATITLQAANKSDGSAVGGTLDFTVSVESADFGGLPQVGLKAGNDPELATSTTWDAKIQAAADELTAKTADADAAYKSTVAAAKDALTKAKNKNNEFKNLNPDTSESDWEKVKKMYAESQNSDGSAVSVSDNFDQSAAKMTYTKDMKLQVGARTKDVVNFSFGYASEGLGNLEADLNASAKGLGTDKLSLLDQKSANDAIDKIDNALNKVSMIRGTFGAVQNRLEHKINNLDTNVENLTAAESRIRDTQMDQEMMKFTSAQILSQASQSMLAQANSLPQGVLQLLG